MTRLVIVICCWSLVAVSCSKEITTKTFPARDIIPNVPHDTIDVHGGDSPIKMLYMGCGHLIIQYGQEMIMTDPWFSAQSFSIGKKIRSSHHDFMRYKSVVEGSGLDLSKVGSAFIAHTHYDHAMDIPLLLKDGMSPNAKIYGNEFGKQIFQNFVTSDQYQSIQPDQAYDPNSKVSNISWIHSSASIRVLPIRSNHAPHLKLGFVKIHLMKGKVNGAYFKENFKTPDAATKSGAWREGNVYAFLVDFLRDGKIDYRLYIQTSASQFPLGRPPEELIAEHPVDIAVLCLASSNAVKSYPEGILNFLQPKKVVFIHWEDFFERAEFNNYRLVRLTNFKKIAKRMTQNGMPLTKEKHVMPQPGTLITIK